MSLAGAFFFEKYGLALRKSLAGALCLFNYGLKSQNTSRSDVLFWKSFGLGLRTSLARALFFEKLQNVHRKGARSLKNCSVGLRTSLAGAFFLENQQIWCQNALARGVLVLKSYGLGIRTSLAGTFLFLKSCCLCLKAPPGACCLWKSTVWVSEHHPQGRFFIRYVCGFITSLAEAFFVFFVAKTPQFWSQMSLAGTSFVAENLCWVSERPLGARAFWKKLQFGFQNVSRGGRSCLKNCCFGFRMSLTGMFFLNYCGLSLRTSFAGTFFFKHGLVLRTSLAGGFLFWKAAAWVLERPSQGALFWIITARNHKRYNNKNNQTNKNTFFVAFSFFVFCWRSSQVD